MGTDKNIKLHIVTDIKENNNSTATMEDINTRLLDTIDLTGDEPVITTKIVKEIFVSLSDDEDEEEEGEGDEENQEPQVKKVRVTSKKCEVCLEEASKYTCPCCAMRTCSLDCVLDHKQKTGCSGNRDKSAFVARTDMNNIHLLNDYRFLEEAARIADNARRDKKSKRPLWTERRVEMLRKHVEPDPGLFTILVLIELRGFLRGSMSPRPTKSSPAKGSSHCSSCGTQQH